MRARGLGIKLDSGEIVCILLFADDIILIADSIETLDELRQILEQWCSDFRMKISISKTSVVTSLEDYECLITDPDSMEEEIVNHVSNYKYLGITQYATPWRTSQKKGESMVARARVYKNVILRTRSQQLDNTAAMSALWQNIAIPGIMYATDAVPISDATIAELEIIQNQIGKSLLGVPQSSANTVVQVELGWKPMRLWIELNKLRFFLRVTSAEFIGSSIVKSCMEWNLRNPQTLYYSNLMSVLGTYAPTHQDLKNVSKKQIHQRHEQKVIVDIQEMVTLKLMPLPKYWWKMSNHIEDARWSRTLVKFRCMNSGLGNRDSYRTADSISQDGGRVLQCPLCFQGDNNEFHLLITCKQMEHHRQGISLRSGQSIQSFLTEQRSQGKDDFQAIRVLLGQGEKINKMDLIDRGMALDILLDKFFLEWFSVAGKLISRSGQPSQ